MLGHGQRSPAIKALAPLPPQPPAAAATAATSSASSAAAANASTASQSSSINTLLPSDSDAGRAPPDLSLGDAGTDSSSSIGERDLSSLVPGAPDDEGHAPKGEHALHQPWTFWYDVADQSGGGGKKADWGASLKKLLEFNSVEQFWGMLNNITRPSNLPMKSDYHLFRFGIKPEWEDPQNRAGGKWLWEMKSAPADVIDQGWLHTLLFLIGEQFSDEGEVLGAVVSLRKGNRSRMALWTRSSSQRDVLMRVGSEWRKALPVSNAVKIGFYSHAQTMKSSARELQPLFTV